MEIQLIRLGNSRHAEVKLNKWCLQIGTYNAAVMAQRHKIPFIVVAPVSTVDLDTPDGSQYVSSDLIDRLYSTRTTAYQLSIDHRRRRALFEEL